MIELLGLTVFYVISPSACIASVIAGVIMFVLGGGLKG